MIPGPASIEDARARSVTHWSHIPGIRDTPEARQKEQSFRAGFLSAAEMVAADGMTVDRLDWMIADVDWHRAMILRKGPKRGLNLDVRDYDERFSYHAFFRGEAHGLRYARPLVGCEYEMQVWLAEVREWASGDPDIPEFPPVLATLPAEHEVSA